MDLLAVTWILHWAGACPRDDFEPKIIAQHDAAMPKRAGALSAKNGVEDATGANRRTQPFRAVGHLPSDPHAVLPRRRRAQVSDTRLGIRTRHSNASRQD